MLALAAGAFLIALALLDALWTTLWLEGHAGPLAGRLAAGIHWLFVRLAGGGRDGGGEGAGRRVNHRLLSMEGPVILVCSVVLWVLDLWAGWATLFSANPGALVDARTREPADLAGRVYFTGYALATLGNGDFSPQGGRWQVAAAIASLTGLLLVTLTVTYLLSVLGAVVRKRAFASQVFALGASAEDFVLRAWDGRGFGALDLHLLSLAGQLSEVTQQHRAYPQLHYYHALEEHNAMPSGVVVLDDALTILRHGVTPEHRPAPAALRVAHETVRAYLDTIRSAHIAPADEEPAPPDLPRVRAAGVPTVSDETFAAAVRELGERRRLLLGLLRSEARQWPPSPG